MSDEHDGAEGWWQASDDKWYPPETHPDYVPPAAAQPAGGPPAGISFEPPPPNWTGPLPRREIPTNPVMPTAPPTAPSTAAAASAPTQGYPADAAIAQASNKGRPKALIVIVAAVLGMMALVVAFSVLGSGDDDPLVTGVVDDAGAVRSADSTEADSGGSETDEAEESQPPRQVSGELGSSGNPLDYETPAAVEINSFGDADGSIWNVRVGEPRDITAQVLAANDFNDPPPGGVAFVGFEVDVTLASASTQPLSPGFTFGWEIFGGSTNTVYDATSLDDVFGCGVVRQEFDNFGEIFAGGSLAGTVCIPLPVRDLNDAETQVAMRISGERVVFAKNGGERAPAPIDSGARPAYGTVYDLDVVVPLAIEVFDKTDNSVWNVQVTPLRDMTLEVLGANNFNDPPPDGIIFAGFEATVTLASTDLVPLAPGFNLGWEVLGGGTARVYDNATFDGLYGCGRFPNEFNANTEVFVGGTVSGTVCLPVPVEDFGHPDTQIAANVQGTRSMFERGGDTPDPAALRSLGGPASLDTAGTLGQTITTLPWDVFSDAEGSVWTATAGPWQDITAEVLADDSLNDPPPTGVVFAGFDVVMTLESAEEEPLDTGFDTSWELLGAATLRVYTPNGLSGFSGCGFYGGQFDLFAEVTVGGSIEGNVCIPVPREDLEHPDTRLALTIGGTRYIFGPS